LCRIKTKQPLKKEKVFPTSLKMGFYTHCWTLLTNKRPVCVLAVSDGLGCTPVGVGDTSKIPDDKITSSSVYHQYYPHSGRLNGSSGWCPSSKSNLNDFIQVDMATVRVICAVATQGKPNGSYTTSYKLSYSVDGVNWNVYKEENIDKV